jgi:hypothetical protein
MANNELFEAYKPAERTIHTQLLPISEMLTPGKVVTMDIKANTDTMVAKGALPSLDLFSSERHTGKELNKQEQKQEGLKAHTDVDKTDGSKTTTVEYPNGVTVSTSDKVIHKKEHDVTISGMNNVEVNAPNKMDKDGNITDAKGRQIVKSNQDGSITVDTGKGFYTQYPNGEIRKETALRTPDGKFEVIDVDTPLGNLRPSDMTVHKK